MRSIQHEVADHLSQKIPSAKEAQIVKGKIDDLSLYPSCSNDD
jgi:hypothetical protein